MALVRYSISVIESISDRCVFSAIVPSWELERILNLAEHRHGVDCYIMISPVVVRKGVERVYIDKLKYHG